MRALHLRLRLGREAWAWASYDFANSVFATTVVAGFFPIFLDNYWRGGLSHTQTFALLAWVNGIVAAVVALAAPVLGAVADHAARRKRFIAGFLLFGVGGTAGLAIPPQGALVSALVLFAVASIGYAAGNAFYDGLLPHIASRERLDRVSALGYALGYLGGGLLFALNVWMVEKPQFFGFGDVSTAVKAAFVSAALWWGGFSLILFAGVHEDRSGAPPTRALGAGLRQFAATVKRLRALPVLAGFLLAYWCYIDGVNSVFRLAVGFGVSLGLPSSALIEALLLTQFVAFPAAIAFGRLGERLGPRAGITLGLFVYIGVVAYASFITRPWQFFLLAVLVGLVQGGTQSLSRSLYARLVPPRESATFFGFYNLMGKFSAVLGPILVAVTTEATGSSRSGILAIVVLFVIGLAGLWLLPLGRARLAGAATGSGDA